MNKTGMRPLKIISITLCVVGICFYIFGQLLMPDDNPNRSSSLKHLYLEWEMTTQDGTTKTVLPHEVDRYPVEEPIELVAKLPTDIQNGDNLAITIARQDVTVYIGGLLRSEYVRQQTGLFGNNGAALIWTVPLDSEDAGKEIKIVTQMAYSANGMLNEIFYGNYVAIWHHFLGISGPDLILAITILLFGIILVVLALMNTRLFGVSGKLLYTGLAVIIACIWILGNTELRQIVFHSLAISNETNFLMVLLVPLPLLIYMNEAQEGRYEKIYQVTILINVANVAICTLLNITGTLEFAGSFYISAMISGASCLLMLGIVIYELIKKRARSYMFTVVGILVAIVCGVIQIFMYVLRNSYANNNLIMLTAVSVVMATSLMEAIREIFHAESQKTAEMEISEAKSQLFTRMSHELRTPINAILGMDSMILRENGDPETLEYARDIQTAGQHLLTLVNDILDFSKLDAGKIRIVESEYYLTQILEEVKALTAVDAEKKGLGFSVTFDKDLPEHLKGDELRLKQILLNLLSNAVKYTKEGHIQLDVTGVTHGNHVRLHVSVKDTGVGIKEMDQQVLFDDYERVQDPSIQGIEGTGLGLNITRRLLELMGSEIKVHSVYGLGSDFYFDLEQEIVDNQKFREMFSLKKTSSSDSSSPLVISMPTRDRSRFSRILIVDDNAMNIKVFKAFLKDKEYQIDSAESGVDALGLVADNHYDVIFLDHMMPGMDGIECLQRMKEMDNSKSQGTPVVALTANDGLGSREFYLENGFDEFLPKPLNYGKLIEILNKFITPGEA